MRLSYPPNGSGPTRPARLRFGLGVVISLECHHGFVASGLPRKVKAVPAVDIDLADGPVHDDPDAPSIEEFLSVRDDDLRHEFLTSEVRPGPPKKEQSSRCFQPTWTDALAIPA